MRVLNLMRIWSRRRPFDRRAFVALTLLPGPCVPPTTYQPNPLPWSSSAFSQH
jgi:hypothetical protein